MAKTSLWRRLLAPVESDRVPWEGASLRVGPLDRYDRYALGVIACVLLLLLVNLPHLKPSMSDTWYHVSVAKHFLNEGGITGWDSYDYAPVGRPHLYPPLLHLLLAALGGLTGNMLLASQLCAATFLPLALLTTWYAGRRLVGSTAALLAVLLLLTDLIHLVVMEAHIAGCLVNILLPLLLVAFLARRAWWSVALLTLMLYSHLGFPVCVALGLLLFGLKYRAYGRLALKVTGISLLFFTPWLAHVLQHLDWLAVAHNAGIPGAPLKKLLSLQMLNLLALGLGLWGIARAPRRQPQRLLPAYLLVGFLPILLSYGGRYTMHTLPLWALLGAPLLTGLLPARAPRRRVLGVILLTLLPWPSLGVMQHWQVLPLTTPHLLVLMATTRRPLLQQGEKTEAYREDCEQLAAWLRRATPPEEVIHVNTVWVADMIALLADRRTDFGAWWECSKQQENIAGRDLRDWWPQSTFVYIKPENDAGSILWKTPTLPGVDHTYGLGRFEVGLRDPHWLAGRGAAVRGWRPVSYAGLGGVYGPTPPLHPRRRLWRFAAGQGKGAVLAAPGPAGSFAGARLRLTANLMSEDLVFGIRTTDGHDYRWPLSLAYPGQPANVRVVFDWMLDEQGKRWHGQAVKEVYFASPADSGKLQGTGERTLEILGCDLVDGGRGKGRNL